MNKQNKLTDDAMASIYGVTTRTYARWKVRAGFPDPLEPDKMITWLRSWGCKSKGLRALDDIVGDLSEHIRHDIEDETREIDSIDGYDDPMAQAKLEEVRSRRDLNVHKLEVLQGEKIDKTVHCQVIMELWALFMESQESNDEEFSEDAEGKKAIEVRKMRVNEREKITRQFQKYLES